MQGVKPFTIAFVTDPTLSRERTQIALRTINALRNIADVRYYPGNLSEEELLVKVQKESIDLLLLPWHTYLKSHKVEAHFGLTRVNGPTIAGYFAEDISPYEIQEEDHHFRAILIDLNRLASAESTNIIKALLRDSTRWGLKPLITQSTSVHYETWTAQVGLGFRIDAILGLNEIAATNWNKRANSIRILTTAMWSLIFDNGPGKADAQRTGAEKSARAYFEVAADSHSLGLRLCYAEPGWKIKDVLHQFWPGAHTPSTAGQVLYQYSDLLRVHVDPESSEIEVVAMLYPSAPAERSTDVLRSLWIEPLTRLSRLERFAEAEETREHYHTPLITNHELIADASIKMEGLHKQLEERDQEILNLRTKGGIRENVFIYPNGMDGGQLLDLFNRRIAESKSKIRSLQQQVQALNKDSPSALKEAGKLLQEIRDLAAQQKGWINKIGEIINIYHEQQTAHDEIAKNAQKDNQQPNEPLTPEEEEEAALAVAGTAKRDVKKPPQKRFRRTG